MEIATKISVPGWVSLILGILLLLTSFGIIPVFGYIIFIPISVSFISAVYLLLKSIRII